MTLQADLFNQFADGMDGGDNLFAAFQSRYRNDRPGFVRDCIVFPRGHEPADYQMEAMELLDTHRRLAIRGPHGIGKTALAAWMILHGVLVADEAKVLMTASAWRQLTHFLCPEMHIW